MLRVTTITYAIKIVTKLYVHMEFYLCSVNHDIPFNYAWKCTVKPFWEKILAREDSTKVTITLLEPRRRPFTATAEALLNIKLPLSKKTQDPSLPQLESGM
jgi:hypothetical protein